MSLLICGNTQLAWCAGFSSCFFWYLSGDNLCCFAFVVMLFLPRYPYHRPARQGPVCQCLL